MDIGVGPLISVVIPTRNAASVIDACLASLSAQTFQDFDVWVMDGMSSDDTVARARNYLGKVGKSLHVHQGQDQGVFDAMNQGIALSGGEWLYFLGADDILHDPDVFADMAVHMKTDNAGIIYGDVIYKNRTTRNRNASPNGRFGGAWTLDRLIFKGNICHQAVFYSRHVFCLVGEFNLRYPVWADWDLNIRCFQHPGIYAGWVDRLVAVYNNHAGLSRNGDPVFREALNDIRLDFRPRRAATLGNIMSKIRKTMSKLIR